MSEMTEKQENAEVENQSEQTEETQAEEQETKTEPEEEVKETEETSTEEIQKPAEEEPVETVEEKPQSTSKYDEFEDLDRVIKVDSLKADAVYDLEEFEELSKLYEQSLKEIQEGELVKGRIVAITEKEIAVDIGFKAEGAIPLDEFPEIETLHIGDEITVFLDKVEDQEGQLVLSKRKADFMATWERMVGHFETQDVIQGKITRRIKGGMVVDLNNIDAFLPGSQIDIHPVRDFDALVGKDMDFRIVKINELRKNIVLSHKVLIEESLAEVREKILLEMEVGQVMEGTVKNITDFGVFVDLGGVDGLLHITDLSWGRISHPSEIVQLDDKITVKIIDFDPVRKRVSIGYKQLLPHPWEGLEVRYPIGAKVTGKVVSITNYGAFIELEKGVEGLIHVSEMSWTQHIKHPSTLLSIGDEVEAVVLSMDVSDRKISLGMKQIEPDPWEALEQKYIANSKHKGTVRELVPFGAFVELEDGIEGLVHISDLSWTKKVHHPGEIVKKGDPIEVVILGFDRNERRIALGYKQIMDSPWEKFAIDYAVNTQTAGKVVRLIDKGVIVELPDNVEGFVPNSQLGRDQEGSIRKRLSAGDELDLIVVEFEMEAKRIVLSASEARKRKEREEYLEHKKAKEAAEKEAEKAKKAETPAEAPEKPAEAKTEEPEVEKTDEAEKPEKEESAEEAPVEKKAKKPAKKTVKKAAEETVKEEPVEPAAEETPAEEKPAEDAVEPVKEKKKPAKKKKAAPKKEEAVEPAAEEAIEPAKEEKPKKTAAKKTKKTEEKESSEEKTADKEEEKPQDEAE